MSKCSFWTNRLTTSSWYYDCMTILFIDETASWQRVLSVGYWYLHGRSDKRAPYVHFVMVWPVVLHLAGKSPYLLHCGTGKNYVK